MVQDNGRGVVAFYDIDTPVTLAQLEKGECDYLSPERIPGYDYYFSFSGGPVPSLIEQHYGAPVAAPLYCRSEERRVGYECVRACRSRCSPAHKKKKH